MRCAVMVDVTHIQGNLKRMADLITAHAAQAGVPTDENDGDGNLVRMDDVVNHHLGLMFSGHTEATTQGFDGYLQEYYPRVADHMLAIPEVMGFMGSQFAVVIGTLAAALQPAIQRLDQLDEKVDDITAYGVKTGELAMYVIDGEPWDTGSVEC